MELISEDSEELVCYLCVADIPHSNTEICKSPTEDNDTDISGAVKEAVKRGRPPKEVEDLVDPRSAGRKQAAVLIPDEKGAICEWAGLKEAGGGIVPITGCPGYPAEHRHHGPDKNTLNNDRHTNLHFICTFCHNRWHALNNRFYLGDRPKDDTPWVPDSSFGISKPHNPELKLSKLEILEIEMERAKKAK